MMSTQEPITKFWPIFLSIVSIAIEKTECKSKKCTRKTRVFGDYAPSDNEVKETLLLSLGI